jgi:hypothetical protein
MKQSLTIAWVLITDLPHESPRRSDRARIVCRPASDAARIDALEMRMQRAASTPGSAAEPEGIDDRRFEPEHLRTRG